MAQMCYCQYKFLGETYTTDVSEKNTANPEFSYECVHEIFPVEQKHLDMMQQPFHVNVFVKPYVAKPPQDVLSTDNPVIIGSFSNKAVAKNSGKSPHIK